MSNPYQSQIDELDKKIEANQSLLNDPELKSLAQQELAKLKEQKSSLIEAADQLQQGSKEQSVSPDSFTNCIVEFRPGTGGDEAKIWAEDLMRMYIRFSEKLALKIEYLDERVIKIKGKAKLPSNSDETMSAFEIFKYESGVHRVQRVPATESQGRIHTSTATVAVLPEVHPQAVEIQDEDLDWQFMRSSGAGGQSVNKTNSAVRLTHKPTGTVVTARQERKQLQNRAIALEQLRSRLWEIEEEKRLKEEGKARSNIGRAMRAEKIRTYNFPQNRVTDHRIKVSWHNLPDILEGDLSKVVLALAEFYSPKESSDK